MHKPEHWEQCIIYQIAMSKAVGSAGNDCPWVLECNTSMSTTFYFLVSSVPYAVHEHDQYSHWKLDGCASARHTGVKLGKPQQTSSLCSLRYQNGIRWEMRQSVYEHCMKFPGQRFTDMLSTRNSAPHLTDILLLLQGFISLQRYSDRHGHLHHIWQQIAIKFSSEVPCILQDPCLQNPLWQPLVRSHQRPNRKQ